VLLDGLLHLYLLLPPLLRVQLGPQAAQVLGAFRGLVRLAGEAFPLAFRFIESSALQLSEPLNVFVLRHGELNGNLLCPWCGKSKSPIRDGDKGREVDQGSVG
jgi:hypothetical protein